MSPFACADGHNAPGLIDEAVPGEAAMVEDVVVGSEDPVREPVVTHELPDILDRIELWAFGRQRQQRDVGRHDERFRAMPSGLVEQQHGMCAGRDSSGDLGQVKRHALGVAAGEDEPGRLALSRADRAVDVRRFRPLIFGR
jgi:hypothetical protein